MSDAAKTLYVNGLSRLLVAGLLAIILPTGCYPRPDEEGMTKNLQTQDITQIPPAMLKEANLRQAWSAQLPLGTDRSVKRIFYHNGQLYVLNDHNLLYALDGSNGGIIWSQQLPAPLAICSDPQYYQDNILFVISDNFVQVRESDGRILEKKKINFTVSTNAARSGNLLFVGSNDRRFYCLNLINDVPLWQNPCSAKPIGNVTISDDKVFFVTEDYNLFVSRLDRRELVWSHKAFGTLMGVIVDQNQCYLPSADTVLYCFDAAKGVQLWRYLAGGRLRELPVLTDSAVYQHVDQKSLLCLERQPDSENGQLRWELNYGRCLLAENAAFSYCLTLDDELAILNNLTGKPVLTFYIPHVDLAAQNNEDAYIFLASKNGNILTLRPN